MAVIVDPAYHEHVVLSITEFSPQGTYPIIDAEFIVDGPDLEAVTGAVVEVEVFGPDLSATLVTDLIIQGDLEVYGPTLECIVYAGMWIQGDLEVFGPTLSSLIQPGILIHGDLEIYGPDLECIVYPTIIVEAEFLGVIPEIESIISNTLDNILLKNNQGGSNWEIFA